MDGRHRGGRRGENVRHAITDDEVRSYHENGYLVLRGALDRAELTRVQEATLALIEAEPGEDYHLRDGILARMEYVVDKSDALKALLANPFILRSTERLMGPDLFPTWDAMVVKMPYGGVAVPWHRDAATECVGDRPIFNVDFYLDEATEENCVWVLPGSHLWSPAQASAWCAEQRGHDQTVEQYRATGALPVLMAPGDVLFHDILVVHGSPFTTANALRRIVYYEFRTAHVEAERGPHRPEYIPLKQRVLLGCLAKRAKADYLPPEEPFVYAPPPPFDKATPAEGEEPPTYRYPHADYWR
jgi:ectoine hydroxylase-related dioxygenase (phytanoyl-CoA dioxygenase family)